MKKLFATLSLVVVLAMSFQPASAKDTLQSNPTKGCYDDLESYQYKVVETNYEEGFKRIKIEGKEAERFIQNSNMEKPPEHAEIGRVFLKLPLTEQKPSTIASTLTTRVPRPSKYEGLFYCHRNFLKLYSSIVNSEFNLHLKEDLFYV
ncbi:hypothetical protein [Paenibacillus tyrfis]|uniref:Uncharacterized protein n=1 Tax=Paenibacillus tyrfis TaxID=1501230 RepID=A0A081P895_9BACL|nr:hypothetical protein [Paenibacillus tyrfis]KEQ26918.1 hypothetical protein ET33_29740 [Paenibacillus tyrfis]